MAVHGTDERPAKRSSITTVLAVIIGVVIAGVLIFAFSDSGMQKSENAALEPNTTTQQSEPGGAPATKQSLPDGASGNSPQPTNP